MAESTPDCLLHCPPSLPHSSGFNRARRRNRSVSRSLTCSISNSTHQFLTPWPASRTTIQIKAWQGQARPVLGACWAAAPTAIAHSCGLVSLMTAACSWACVLTGLAVLDFKRCASCVVPGYLGTTTRSTPNPACSVPARTRIPVQQRAQAMHAPGIHTLESISGCWCPRRISPTPCSGIKYYIST
jgi:hypothetical protein